MVSDNVVMSAGVSSTGQGYLELAIAIVLGLVCLAFLVVGVVATRRGSGKSRMWFGLAVGVFAVWALSLSLL